MTMRDTMTTVEEHAATILGALRIAIMLSAVALFAFMFRYQPLPPAQGATSFVWDRLTHRTCVVYPGWGSHEPGPICTREDYAAALVREKENAAAALAGH
jgi:hypothetical protein